MPIQLRHEGRLLLVDIRGPLAGADLVEAAQELARLDIELDPTPDRLVDLSTVERIAVDFSAVCSFAEARMASAFKNKVKTAFVATTPVQYGFARMYQSLNRNPLLFVEVFRDRGSALAWLGCEAVVDARCL